MFPFFPKILAGSLLLLSLTAPAQHRRMYKSILDDGPTLTIRFDLEQAGRVLHYRRTFDVAHLSQPERDALQARILDSLNVGAPTPPTPPRRRTPRPAAPEAPTASAAADVATVLGTGPGAFSKSVRRDAGKAELFLRYAYERDGVGYLYERTADIRGYSERQIEALIRATERELGLLPERQAN